MKPAPLTIDGGDPAPRGDVSAPLLPMHHQVVLVMDLVESVRLMAADEQAVIALWRGFVRAAVAVLQRHGGRLVKSLGDGIMAVFDASGEAASAALELQRHFDSVNASLPPERRLYLRAGLNATQVFLDDIDIYGSGVNLAARIASLAGPGETLVSVEVRDQLTDGLNGALVDLGDCYFKHIAAPVRVYRLAAHGPQPAVRLAQETPGMLQAAVAVIPFSALGGDLSSGAALGDAIADDIIGALSASTSLRVIARLSTVPFRRPDVSLQDIRRLLGAAYIVFGQYSISGGKMHVRVQLCAAQDGQVLWADALTSDVADIFNGQDQIVPVIAANTGRVILQKELERTRQLPLSNLESYSLYVSSISLLHRSSHRDFLRARELLDHLSHRHPNRPALYALAAKWHLMRILQGWSENPSEDGRQALALAHRALRCDPENAFAMATQGFLAAHFSHDLLVAGQRCTEALQIDPQEAQVWRMRAAIHSYVGEGEQAQACAAQALSLSPLDPTRFIYELIMGAGKLASGRFDEALEWADKSLRANLMHVPTHRLRVLALSLSGRDVEAREAARELLRICPQFSVDAFSRSYPGRDHAHAQDYFRALRNAGLPA